MARVICFGCNRWFSRLEQHLAYNPICMSVMIEHDLWQNLLIRCQHQEEEARTNINSSSASDTILGMEIVASKWDGDDNISTTHSTRHSKKQRTAEREDDNFDVTFIPLCTSPDAPSYDEPPSIKFHWEGDNTSIGTMEAVLQQENPPNPSHCQHQFPLNQNNQHSFLPMSLTAYDSPLGSTHVMPVVDCVAHMTPNTDVQDALLDLFLILAKAGSPLGLYNTVVAFIECHARTTFEKGCTLPCHDTLIKEMPEKHYLPSPMSMPVPLEINAANPQQKRARTSFAPTFMVGPPT
jgi:hypothetical protein